VGRDDFLDEESEAYIRFDADGGGAFHFGYVQAVMDCRLVERDGKPAVEWSWEGNDEMTPTSGRGWAVLQDDGTLVGRSFFFQGEEEGVRHDQYQHRRTR